MLVVSKLPKVQFLEDILHSDESLGILLNDVCLRLLDVFRHVPYVQRVLVPRYQPHLIYKIKGNHSHPLHIHLELF